jgi:hypothetical protein
MVAGRGLALVVALVVVSVLVLLALVVALVLRARPTRDLVRATLAALLPPASAPTAAAPTAFSAFLGSDVTSARHRAEGQVLLDTRAAALGEGQVVDSWWGSAWFVASAWAGAIDPGSRAGNAAGRIQGSLG